MQIKIDDLAKTVMAELKDYSREMAGALKAESKEIAKACVQELKTTSPYDNGDYSKGWTSTTSYESDREICITVHNKDHYQHTHLLEDGHANVDGGRTPSKPHIGPAADNAAAKLEKAAEVIAG